jgi:hypothetical protein
VRAHTHTACMQTRMRRARKHTTVADMYVRSSRKLNVNTDLLIDVELTRKCKINYPVQIYWKYFQQFSSCHGCTDSMEFSWANNFNGRLQECMGNNKCNRS